MIGLGSNMDHPVKQIQDALREIAATPACSVIKMSMMYESSPVGGVEQAHFINAVAEIETTLTPRAMMARLLEIELQHGRVRTTRNGPRTLDLDILMFNDWLIDEPDLVIPHPRAHERAFVLLPLIEISPDISIPGVGVAHKFLASVSAQAVERYVGHERQELK
ncbi:MAG: 2-amino-4-hydroxy-6-hydroxymethyldihydropteridine diphosphokinase [Aeromicrobium sp.]|nr:2-amino-4-hydroxy-6-hydroxymethyldihydropteridine diphosphokinase [Burkholderiales bacterium]